MCSMYAVYVPNMCSKVTCMYAACMLYTYVPNMCSKVADIYTIKNGVYNIHYGCTTCQSKTTPKGVQKRY